MSSDLPTGISVLRLHTLGDAASLVLAEEPLPVPADGELLVEVHAAAITRDELTWPEGLLPAIPAHEFSGTVVGSGEAVYALGQFEKGGSAAQYIAVGSHLLAPKPSNLTHAQSATIPLAALSAWQALFEHGKLESGQRVLIHGATGAVGAFAVQLAHHAGAHVIAVASDTAAAATLGADEVVDRGTTKFEDAAGRVDLVFDTVGGDLIPRSRSVLGVGGRLVTIAEEPAADWAGDSGATAEYFIVQPNREQLAEITSMVEAGRLLPSEVHAFPLAEARAAFEASVTPGHRGKVVLEI